MGLISVVIADLFVFLAIGSDGFSFLLFSVVGIILMVLGLLLSIISLSDKPKIFSILGLSISGLELVVAMIAGFFLISEMKGSNNNSEAKNDKFTTVTGQIKGHDYVDLGLSVYWATCNVGAETPGEMGDFYAWGETQTKPIYSSVNYKFRKSGTWENKSISYSKYCINTTNKESLWDDTEEELSVDDDVASQKWGEEWSMPGFIQIMELIDSCDWIPANNGGMPGFCVKSRIEGYTDRTIFIPAAGCFFDDEWLEDSVSALIWSRELSPVDINDAALIHIDIRKFLDDEDMVSFENFPRFIGMSVRPVVRTPETEMKEMQITENMRKSSQKRAIQAKLDNFNEMDDAEQIAFYQNLPDDTKTTFLESLDEEQLLSFSEKMIEYYIHPYVDLGLSVKWATCNVGAEKPEDYGDYYAWGETVTKSTYDWHTYKYCDGSVLGIVTKYCNDSSRRNNGFTDSRTTLEMSDDVVHQKWGGNWRMPKQTEFNELINNCTWTWTTLNGIKGYRVTSNKSGYTDRWIFLPAAGRRSNTGLYDVGSYGGYWSSSLYTSYPSDALKLSFNSGSHCMDIESRYEGLSVRPVCP